MGSRCTARAILHGNGHDVWETIEESIPTKSKPASKT
jgi:hypothetical protein